MLKVYAKIIGLPYLYYTLGPKLLQIQIQEDSLEVDPHKVRPNENVDVKINKWQLLVVAQEFLKAITESVNRIPFQFRQVRFVRFICDVG